VGSACGPCRVSAVDFIGVTPGLTPRLWASARMPECGILAEAGRAGQHEGTGGGNPMSSI